MLGLPRHCGMNKFRAFLCETPVSLLEELRWRHHSYWVDITLTLYSADVLEEGEVAPEPYRLELGNLSKREAKTVARLFKKGAVPYFAVETNVQ